MEGEARLIAAVQTASKKLAGTGDFGDLLREVLAICVEAVGVEGGTIYLHDPASRTLAFRYVLPEEVEDRLPFRDIADDYGTAGAAFQARRTIVREFDPPTQAGLNPFERATGLVVRNMLVAPLAMKDETPVGVVQLLNRRAGPFEPNDAAIVETIAAVAALTYANRRLVEESSRASTLLGMGKVSHDIGNLASSLHATLSYSQMALDGFRGHLLDRDLDAETEGFLLNQRGAIEDVRHSVDRIIGYSRLISDMSAGRALRPSLHHAPLAELVGKSAAYLESDARHKRVELVYDMQKGAPPCLHDDLYVFRIVQNLVGNAIKAVVETLPEGAPQGETPLGRVTVRYRHQAPDHLIEVEDTGPGMTDETARRILSGDATSQWNRASGSGWGLRIVNELAGAHDGRLEIESRLGEGSTFRVVLPDAPLGLASEPVAV